MFTRHQQRSVLFKRLQPNQNKVQKEKSWALSPTAASKLSLRHHLGWERARAQKSSTNARTDGNKLAKRDEER